MPDDSTALLLRMIGNQPGADQEVLELAPCSTSTPLLVAAALLTNDLGPLTPAVDHAATTRDRQLIAIAEAHLRGDADLLHVLVRDHLSEHPDNLLASWIAGRASPTPMTHDRTDPPPMNKETPS